MYRKELLQNILSKIKNTKYIITYEFSIKEIFSIFFDKLIGLIRGTVCIKPFLRKSTGFVFAEKGAKIKFGHKITCGRNLYLRNNCLINALSTNGIKIGDNFTLGRNSIIECSLTLKDIGDKLIIGNNVGINHYCFIGVRGEIHIGSNVLFGPYVTILSENHIFEAA